MFKRTRTAFLVAATLALSACGTPATPFPTLLPTQVLPTRVPVASPTGGAAVVEVKSQPTAVAVQASATPRRERPTATPTITLIPPTATPAPPTSTPTLRPADAAIGKELFNKSVKEDEGIPACASCHLVAQASEDEQLLKPGPSLWSNGVDTKDPIGIRAATRVTGESALTYLRNSILRPNEYLVPNSKIPNKGPYSVGTTSIMYQNYSQYLTPQQLDDLVAYLLTVK